MKVGAPIIGINDSGGARIQEGVASLAGYAEVFKRNVLASGVVPQISVIMGPCAGGAVYSPAMTDFIFMVKNTSFMFVTGPDVVKTVTQENVSQEELGGAKTHTSKSSVADGAFNNDIETLHEVKNLIDLLPASNREKSTNIKKDFQDLSPDYSLDTLVPDNPNKPYDMKELITKVADNNYFFEIQKDFAKNIITGFGTVEGRTVGFVANQPLVLAGCLDIDSGKKGATEILYRNEIKDKEKIEKRTDDYTEQFANPFIASKRGFIDDVIRPHSTRKRIATALENLKDKELSLPLKKHDNIPL